MSPGPKPKAALVLVVDDNAAASKALRRLLQQRGFGVTVAADCLSAIDAFEHVRPDIAVIDLRLPDCDGASLARRLRAIDSIVPLICLSGAADEAPEGPTFDAVLSKPVDIEVLEAQIRTLLGLSDG